MKTYITLLLLIILVIPSMQAQEKLFPVIEGYGAVEIVPFESVKPDPNETYKLINELSSRLTSFNNQVGVIR